MDVLGVMVRLVTLTMVFVLWCSGEGNEMVMVTLKVVVVVRLMMVTLVLVFLRWW